MFLLERNFFKIKFISWVKNSNYLYVTLFSTPWKNHGSYNIPAAHDNPGYEMDTNSYSASHNGNGNSERRKSSSVSAAVRIQHASKSYGSGPKVLNDLNMTIEKGTM